MAMQQCPNGHLYDDSKNSTCPYCGGNGSIDVTVPLDGAMPQGGGMFPPTAQLGGFGADGAVYTPPQPQVIEQRPAAEDFPETMPVGTPFEKTTYKTDAVNENGIAEIRGWLICIDGPKRGVDFRIHGEKNSIGRGEENEIKLDFDTSISKGVNAIIAYDSRNNKFFIYQSASKNNMYINNTLLLTPVELKDYDVIEIGETKLVFRSFCNESFTWESLNKED